MSNSSVKQPHICILLLNWNGWQDTIECLESVFRLKQVSFEVVVCDNGSSDGSVEKIEAWAQGKLEICAANPGLSNFVTPAVPKPLQISKSIGSAAAISAAGSGRDASLKIIETGANLGFAGGNNCGLRYCLARGDFDYVWLLNNDTIVPADSLFSLVTTMEEDPLLGMCGSVLHDYWHPAIIQTRGGKFYSRWSARVHAIQELSPRMIIDYVDGASMLVSRKFLQAAGVMDETFFLYFEELAWARVAVVNGFRMGLSPRSVVYHKEGASAGTHRDPSARGLVSERFLARNRIYFTRRFHVWALPTVTICVSLTALRAAIRRDWKRAKVILAALLEGFQARLP